MKCVKSFSRGFTMIELLVVIAIIGVLAAVLVPFIGNIFGKGAEADAREDLRRLGQAALSYKTDHEGHYPAAGGYFYDYRNGQETLHGRAIGWVNFQHNCATYAVENTEAWDKVGDGSQDVGNAWDEMNDNKINEQGMCLCFEVSSESCGIDAQPAGWHSDNAKSGVSLPQAAIRGGAIYGLVNNMETYVNSNFADVAKEKRLVGSADEVVRAYAMNVITGTDEDLYGTNEEAYAAQGKGRNGYYGPIQWGAKTLYARESGNETAKAEPNRTVLFVELDLDDLTASDELKGDQVWDWDHGNESIGFNFLEDGQKFGFVCFADGSVQRINDPSKDPENPDTNKRRKLSKWYGSGGVCADGEKLD